jgi:hypothetical protein
MKRSDSLRTLRFALLLGLSIPSAGCSQPADAERRPALGLVSGLPIYWGDERGGFAAAFGEHGETHWVRAALEERASLVPLDQLSTDDGYMSGQLEAVDRLLIVQPRALTPADNVALDRWVRAGGRLVLALDPMLTEHSHLPLGDPRRPNASALIPPLLARWGVAMTFDPDASPAQGAAAYKGTAIPFELAGRLAVTSPAMQGDRCAVSTPRIIASCRIGKGRALVLADAHLFAQENGGAANRAALTALTAEVFDLPAPRG